MKIKTKVLSYEQVMALPRSCHRKPMKPWLLLRLVVRVLAILDLHLFFSFPILSA